MTRSRKAVLSLGASLIAVVALTVAASAASYYYYDSVSGAELPNATQTEGQFVGVVTGSLPGDWYLDVRHDQLASPGTAVAITGGSFSLNTVINWHPVTVAGSGLSGTVVQQPASSRCSNQQFAVTGSIARVGINGGSTGTGTFGATLTHYRVWIWWLGCVTYSATITGFVSLSF